MKLLWNDADQDFTSNWGSEAFSAVCILTISSSPGAWFLVCVQVDSNPATSIVESYFKGYVQMGLSPSLKIWEMEKVKKVGVEFMGRQEGTVFPKLKQLCFEQVPNWEEWEEFTKDSSEITIMPHLSSLIFHTCPKLKALPDFLCKTKELRTLLIHDCPILEGEYKKDVGKEWHNISHIPNLTIQSQT